ncbi:MAG: hypothetical protein QXX20_02535 [Candidatus Thermoplasmatota archaeon]
MGLFKKNKKDTQIRGDTSQILQEQPSDKIKKKKRIGFGHKQKKDKIQHNQSQETPQTDQLIMNIHQQTNLYPHKNSQPGKQEVNTVQEPDIFLEDTLADHDLSKQSKDWNQVQKRNALLQKDAKGKPVFLEDTGEQLGVVFDTIKDSDNKIIGYKIKDSKSDAILSFPLDQFDEDKNGLIFVPSWYTKGLKTIEKLEFKDRISPELAWLLKDQTISDEELYNIFVKHDDVIANYMQESIALRELLENRLKALEKERLKLKEDLMDLTEKRLIKDIDRRTFSEIVLEHRRKVNVIDVNIKKCKELFNRLEKTSFGMLGKTIQSRIVQKQKNEPSTEQQYKTQIQQEIFSSEDNKYKEKYEKIKVLYDELEEEYKNLKNMLNAKLDDGFENKYHELKNNYDELLAEYDELKLAVEKLLQKNNV